MKLGFFNFYEVYNNNKMFEDASSPIGDDLMYPFVYLHSEANRRGIEVSTIDTQPLECYEEIFFLDFPTMENKYFKELVGHDFNNLNLILLETELIRPDNWDENNHKYFKKIYTWHDGLVDNKKYFKMYLPNRIPEKFTFNSKDPRKLCTLIASHKFVKHPQELYTARLEAIRWFEKNHPEDFDLYGFGWDQHRFSGSLIFLNNFPRLNQILKSHFPSYRGSIDSKFDTLQGYKFAICYENARDIKGYITEKIFDCFFAGCVPVYWGAPNVTDVIPKETFIDKREYDSYSELYNYITNMSDEEYNSYIAAIKEFMEGEKVYPFSAEYFAETLLKNTKTPTN
jgi:alpha(1,3/1,4) fucosyltransferase